MIFLPSKDTIIEITIDNFFISLTFFLLKKKKTQNQTLIHLHSFVIFCLIKKNKKKSLIMSIIISWSGNISYNLFIKKTYHIISYLLNICDFLTLIYVYISHI
jgi:hypothetical protein